MKKGAATDRKDSVPGPTEPPEVVPVPPLMPLQREFRRAVLEATGGCESPAEGESVAVSAEG